MTRKPNLDGFKARGGKFIFFQGWADPVITPMMDVDFYNRVVARYGQAATDGFFRFFPLAGMGHCSGGAGLFPYRRRDRRADQAMIPTMTWSRRWTDG